MRIVAIVLAAGEGRRMGGPKALLRIGPETFLSRVVGLLSRPEVAAQLVVLGSEAERIVVEGGVPAAAAVILNPGYGEGMLTSVLRGLEAAEGLGAEAVLLHPVDHPLVEPATVDRVVEALGGGALIAVPSHSQRRGHPAGFSRGAWAALRAASPHRGARGVLLDHPDWVVHVAGDPGCIAGVNTPEEYARLIERG
jgi:CTP:molybdopterin cytidylyltransferase MocA